MDLDFFLRLLQPRWWIGISALLLASWLVGEYGGQALNAYDVWAHPHAEAASPLASDLKRDVQARESAHLRGLHRTVSAEIAAARAQGFDVDKLQRLADSALKLDDERYRSAAVERLNKLRLVIPQKRETFRPAGQDDASPDPFEAPRPKKKGRR